MSFLFSCTSEDDNKEESAPVKEQEKVADEATQIVETPLDLAKKAAQ